MNLTLKNIKSNRSTDAALTQTSWLGNGSENSSDNLTIFFEQKQLSSKEQSIHERALRKAAQFKKAHAELLQAVMDVDAARLFEKFLLNSTFAYCTRILKLSEDVTCTLTRLARISVAVPELKMAIDSQSLSISNARHIASIVTPENKTEWIEKAKNLPQRQLQQAVASAFPQQAAVQEKTKFVSAERIKLEMGLDSKMMDNFRRAQDLVSRKQRSAATLEATLEELLRVYLEKFDPLLKAERAEKRTKKNLKLSVSIRGAEQKSLVEDQSILVRRALKRTSIPASIQHAVNRRDANQCQAQLPDGTRCGSKRWLDYHHRVPVQVGGKNTLENLTTLCSFHHQALHKK